MRILACSDLHCDQDVTRRILALAGDVDALVVAGDLAIEGHGALPILTLLRAQPRPVVIVPGNHDNLTQMRAFCQDWASGHLLHGEGVTLRGTTFFGLGGEIPRSGDALWNLGLTEAQATAKLADCPDGAVLITHSPPKGHCDRRENGAQDGSQAVLKTIQAKQPRLHLCGHIHASFGESSRVGECGIYNLGKSAQAFSV